MEDRRWLIDKPVAHRGFHDRALGRIENTQGAFQAALDQGFAIECDVQVSADAEVMVFHDFTLERLTEAAGPVRARTAADLQKIPFSETSERMQTLGGLLEQINGQQTLLVEIKSDWKNVAALTRRAADLATNYKGPIALMSFDPRVLRILRSAYPGIIRGIIAEKPNPRHSPSLLAAWQRHMLSKIMHAPFTAPHFVAYQVRDLPAAAPARLRRNRGLPLLTWTVRTAQDRAVAGQHADQMIFEGFNPAAD